MPERPAASTERPFTGRESTPQLPAIVALDEGECRQVLARQRLCVMAVVDGPDPYAVPLYFGFDGEAMYVGVAEGRKTRALDANPRVCIVVMEEGPGDAWRSVAVAGVATVLHEAAERARGIQVLVDHNRRSGRDADGAARPVAAPRRRTGGRVLRIDGAVITGRARSLVEGGAGADSLRAHSTT